MKCKLLSFYYTVRYGLNGFFNGGYILLGHEFEFTGKIHNDHWEMQCTRCGMTAGSELGPQAVDNLQKK